LGNSCWKLNPLPTVSGSIQVDLFSKQETTEHDVGENGARSAASSPFLAAARLQDTGILKFFMQLWDERYGSAGRNDNGEYPIHVLCRDKHGETR
jgi:hypothetical protein